MAVQWIQDSDTALEQAKSSAKPVLLDFSAAPALGGCVRLEAESYANQEVVDFINESFLPVTFNIKHGSANFHRFEVLWTPAVVILDNGGKERFRIEGYLPREEFVAQLEMGLARVAFVKKQWADAEDRYNGVVAGHATSAGVPQAMYWAAVSHYKKTQDHTVLGRVAQELSQKYPGNFWTQSASVWLPAAQQKTA